MSLTVSVADIVEESDDPLLAAHPSWERIKLGVMAEIVNGFAFQSKRFSNTKGTPLLRIRDVGKDDTECRYDGPFDDRYLVRAGDLVIGMDGDFRCARWKGPDALLNQRVCKITLLDNLYDPRFLDLVLPGYLRAIKERTSSVTVTHLSSRSIADIPLPLPPLAEQRRIAERLTAVFDHLELARSRLAGGLGVLKRFRQSVLDAACSGRLTEDWRYRALPQREGQRSLPGDPQTLAFGCRPLESLLSGIEAGRSFACVERPPTAGEVGVVKVSAVTWGTYDEGESKTCIDPQKVNPALFVVPGDFLFSRANTIELVGACVIARRVTRRIMLSDKILRFRFRDVLPEWILIVLRSHHGRAEIERLATGNQQSMRNIGQDRICEIRVPVPVAGEQREIARRVEALLGLAEAVEQRIEAAAARAEKLIEVILAKAFRGALVPTEAELAQREGRSCEPVSRLLMRSREA